jgi:hypothetical protein
MQTDRQAGTVIFVSNRTPEATVAQDIEACGLVVKWARSIREAVDLLYSAREKTVIVTELAMADAVPCREGDQGATRQWVADCQKQAPQRDVKLCSRRGYRRTIIAQHDFTWRTELCGYSGGHRRVVARVGEVARLQHNE